MGMTALQNKAMVRRALRNRANRQAQEKIDQVARMHHARKAQEEKRGILKELAGLSVEKLRAIREKHLMS